MADIMMCNDKTCTLKDNCYRYTAEKCPYKQSYFGESPKTTIENESVCDYFWNNNDK